MGTLTSQRSSFRRYLTTNSTASAFNSALSNGDKQLTVAQAQALTIIPIGNSLTAQILFFGVGADATTYDYRVWGLWYLSSVDSNGKIVVDPLPIVRNIGSGTVTLGSVVGITGSTALATTDAFAKTLTFVKSASTVTTPLGAQTSAETAYNEGNATVHNPAAAVEAIATLFLPCLMRCTGLIVDFDMTGATSGNCLILTDDV